MNNQITYTTDTPALLRYQNIIALRAGLAVSYCSEAQAWAWRGTELQFAATGLFPKKFGWDFVKNRRAWTVLGIRDSFMRSEPGSVSICHKRFDSKRRLVKRGCDVLAPIIAADKNFQQFRERVFNTVFDPSELE